MRPCRTHNAGPVRDEPGRRLDHLVKMSHTPPGPLRTVPHHITGRDMQIPPLPAPFVAASSDQVINIAYEYVSEVFANRHGDDEDEALRALPVPLADLWILQWLDYEVIQGGLATSFMNSHGRQALLAVDALRRCGLEDAAQCLSQARAIVVTHEAAWAKRTQELDALGEYAVVQPFQGLQGIEQLWPFVEEFRHLWFDSKPHWGEFLQDDLERFRAELAKKDLP